MLENGTQLVTTLLERDNGWTPNKATINYQFSTDEKEDKPTEQDEDDSGVQGGAAGRKKRLKALASKFKAYDDDEEEIVAAKLVADAAATQSSPEKRNQVKNSASLHQHITYISPSVLC